LLDPIEIKGLSLKNRIVMPPMGTGLATTEGAVTEAQIEHYVRRSSKLGLQIVEYSYISLDGKNNKNQLGIYDDSLIPGLEKLSSSIHAKATPNIIQINHAGNTASMDITGIKPVGPSSSENVKELQVKEIEALVESFANAAERAMKAGFDGVEVHGAHGFLLNQFYSPLTNRRQDEYGGSLENRMRLPLEVIKKVKDRIGGRLLLYRLGSVDLNPTGTQIEDSKKFAMKLEEAGVDIIDISGGLCGSRPAQLQDIKGYFIPQAQEIKKVVDIPIIGVGRITEPEYADRLIQEGRIDLVAIGRALLNDPDWAVKAIKTLKKG
jgi:2,4-dienoyl-CoA reductase-like NADH-dependent reductase (Old Yellow Enzyme family)